MIITGKPGGPDIERFDVVLAGLLLLNNEQLGARVRADLVRKAEHQARVLLCARTLLNLDLTG